MIAAHTPPVVPADRSISPSSSTKTRPIAITMIGAGLDDQRLDVVGAQEALVHDREEDDDARSGRRAPAASRSRRP